MQMINRRAALGIGFSALATTGAVLWPRSARSAFSDAVTPASRLGVVPVRNQTHDHGAAEPELREFQRQMRGVVADLKQDQRRVEALRRGAAVLSLWAAHLQALDADGVLQRATRQSIKERGRQATVLLEPDYREMERHVRASGGDLVPQISVFTPPDYAERERQMDALLRGQGVVALTQAVAQRFEQVAATLAPLQTVRVQLGDGSGGNPTCDAMCADARAYKDFADYVCAIAAACAIYPPCAPEAAVICGSFMTIWVTMETMCMMCKLFG